MKLRSNEDIELKGIQRSYRAIEQIVGDRVSLVFSCASSLRGGLLEELLTCAHCLEDLQEE